MNTTTDERTGTDTPGRVRAGSERAVRYAAVLVTIVPVWVAAIRTGLRGLPPVGDAALTTLRATDVLTAHPPLVGMFAAGASAPGHSVYFPAAWQLYVMAIPTRVLGTVWGPVIAMAALNTVWILLACRLLLRRLDTARALMGIAFVAVFAWSAGSGLLITPVPMDMVTIPFVTFLIATWCVAAGDTDALWILALVANFLWLDHLVLVLVVPVVGLCAVVGFGFTVAHRRRRRADETRPPPEGGLRRSVIAAAVITVIMWLPPIIQQLFGRTGNLHALATSAARSGNVANSWLYSIRVVVEMVARPPFWLRGTFKVPPYGRPPIGSDVIGPLTIFDVLAGCLIIGAIVVLGVAARRRGDRVGLWALVVAVVAMAVQVPNIHLAPTSAGFPTQYLRSLNGTAMFVWFAVALNLTKLAPRRVERPLLALSATVIVVVTLVNLPTSKVGYATDASEARLARAMTTAVIPEVASKAPVELRADLDLHSQAYFSALALELSSRGIPYCVPRALAPQVARECDDDPRPVVTVRIGDADGHESDEDTGGFRWSGRRLDAGQRTELAALDRRITAWLDTLDRVELTPATTAFLDRSVAPDVAANIRALFAPADGDLHALTTSPLFLLFVSYTGGVHDKRLAVPFVDSPLSAAEWSRWVHLRERDQTLEVTVQPVE